MERIDDLQRGGFRIIQDPDKFCFGIDAVLLAAFAKASPGQKVMDLCTGSGVVPLLMLSRYPGTTYVGVEVQTEVADMAGRSMLLNHVEKEIEIWTGDIKDIPYTMPGQSFDVVTANPPYLKTSQSSLRSDSFSRALARHELSCTLDDVVRIAAYLIKPHGHFYMVHRPSRLPEIMQTLLAHDMEPKGLQLIHPFQNHAATQVLIDSVRMGGKELRVYPPLITYDAPGEYTEDVRRIYHDPAAPFPKENP